MSIEIRECFTECGGFVDGQNQLLQSTVATRTVILEILDPQERIKMNKVFPRTIALLRLLSAPGEDIPASMVLWLPRLNRTMPRVPTMYCLQFAPYTYCQSKERIMLLKNSERNHSEAGHIIPTRIRLTCWGTPGCISSSKYKVWPP